MTNTPNTNSSVNSLRESAVHYDKFLGPMFFEPYAIEIAERIDPSSVAIALEIAAGTGRVTNHIRRRIPSSAKLIASDINADMLAVAKEKLSDLSIDWQNIDAQQLPFADSSIDLIVCSFGYMFVPDKATAFAAAYRVLKPGGTLLFTTWDKLENNAASFIARSVVRKYYEGPLPASSDQATSMNDAAIIRPFLENAGFSGISIEKVQKDSVCATAKEAAIVLVQSGPAFEEIKKRDPTSIDEIITTVEIELSDKFGAAPMIAPISAVVCQAWK